MEGKGSIVKLAVILLAITFISTLILAVCNDVTKDAIAAINEKTQNAAKAEVLPEADSFSDVEGEFPELVTAVFEGKKGGDTVGYCVNAVTPGFGGDIQMMVGVSLDLEVTGVKITSSSETPGLGAKASNADYTDRYKGLGKDIAVIKSGVPTGNEVSAISGATITSKAVTDGVNAAVKYVETLK